MNGTSSSKVYGPEVWGPYEPWSEWQTWAQSFIRLYQFRVRFLPVTQTVTTVRYFERCDERQLNNGYVWASSRHETGRSTESVTIAKFPFFEYRVVLRPFSEETIPDQEIVALAAMHPGDRLGIEDSAIRGSSDESLTLTLDGEDFGPQEVIDASELGVGYHFLDIESRGKGRAYKAQLVFSVTHSIEARFTEPLREVTADLAEGPIGQQFTLEIRNDTGSDLVAYVQAHSVPAGWKVLVEGEDKVSLDPWATASVELIAELMNDQGLREGLVPLTVEVRPVGRDATRSTAVYATCYARLKPKQPIDEIVAANEELRRRHAGKVYEVLKRT